jgi:hypothetical protein
MTIDHGLTDEELAALAPEERAAITAEPSQDEARLASGAVPGVTDDGVADPLKSPGKTEVVIDATDPEDRDPIPVAFQAPAVDDRKVQAVLADIAKRFDDGEITMPEMLAQRDAVNSQVTEARLSSKHGAQIEATVWGRTVEDFIDRNKIYGTDPVLYDALDATVKRLAADRKNENLSDRKLIEEAHRQVAERFRVGAAEAPPLDPAQALAARRKPNLTTVPRTLAHVPVAAPANIDQDEFSDVDRLISSGDSAAAERAVARMTPEQQERWARAG